MSWKAFPATLILGFAAAEVAADDPLREQSRRSVEVGGVSTVAIENARGAIEVRAGDDDRLHIAALKIVRAPRGAEARRLSARTVVELVREDERYVVRVRYPRSHPGQADAWDVLAPARPPRVEVRLVIEVPEGVDVEVEGMSARLVGERLAGRLTMKTGSGDALLDGCRGEVRVATVSGAIEFRRTSGAIDLETVSGDVHGILATAPGEARISTTSGDIRLALPEAAGCELEMRTTSGDLDLRVPCRARTVNRSHVSAVIGDGAAPVRLRSISGSVVVMRGSS